jgi:ATP-dependent Clp protease adaptor protein ClpS
MAEKEPEEGKNGGSTAVAPKEKRKESPKRYPPKQLPPFKVLLHNDDVNDTVYVVSTIVCLTTLDEGQAEQRMMEAHESGVALLLVTHKERAELYQEQFQSKGLTVTIEPAE